jgi:ATP-dependent DNA helicase RecQ
VKMRAMTEPLPFHDDARAELKRHFGLGSFRPGQAEVIDSVIAGRNVVVVMPTGAGKSLCYQLPALMLKGLTLVVSPLIALMKDQVEQLEAKGIPATLINSTVSDLDRAERIRRMRAGAYRLVYVAPERFRSAGFLDALEEVGVELFAVDEAHCISQWGHDFRPDYAQLGQIRKRLRPPRTLALTATATPEVREDIVRVLLMKDPRVFVAGFDRPNLFLELLRVSGDEERRAACGRVLAEGGSGIVYCATRKQADGMQAALRLRGHDPVVYHAGMDEDERRRAQDRFMGDPQAVAVATNAFGMGIDKPDIRFVIHANIPRAVEAYYQEVGRAGRDGRPGHALLLFNHADVFTQERLIESNHPSEAVIADVWNALQGEEVFARGQQALASAVGASEFEVSAALRILEREGLVELQAAGQGAHGIRLLDVADLRLHSKSARVLLRQLGEQGGAGGSLSVRLDTLGSRLELSPKELRRALSALERAGAVRVRRPFAGRGIRALRRIPFHALDLSLEKVRRLERRSLLMLRRMTDYAYARTCRRSFLLSYFGEEVDGLQCGGCDVCSGQRTVLSPLPASRSSGTGVYKAKGRASERAMDDHAAEALRRFRRDLSRDLDLPPFILFTDRTLQALATALPLTREDFLAVKGTGPTSWERFGPKVVEICRGARDRTGAGSGEAQS